jgi:uncharacterized protein YbjT (DUF2867 family)
MEILINGLNNYVARNFVSYLASQGHQITCLLNPRQKKNAQAMEALGVQTVMGDLWQSDSKSVFPENLDLAYYFNQAPAYKRVLSVELIAFQHFLERLKISSCKHLIFVTRLTDQEIYAFEKILRQNQMTFTLVRVSNILGKEALLVDILAKLSSQSLIFISKQFVERKCRPIALEDVCYYLDSIALDERCFGEIMDLGGPQIITYKQLYEMYQSLLSVTNRVVMLPSWSQKLSVWLIESLFPQDHEVGEAFGSHLKADLVKTHPNLQDWFPFDPLNVQQSLLASLDPMKDPVDLMFHEWR